MDLGSGLPGCLLDLERIGSKGGGACWGASGSVLGRIIDGGGERLAVRFSQKACSHKNISGATHRYRHLPSESVIQDLKNRSSVSRSMPLVMNTSFV